MPALTKTQIEHAKSRIAAAKNAYIHRYMAELGEEPEVVDYTEEQKEALIRSGEAKLKTQIHRYAYEFLDNFIYIDTPEMAEARKRYDLWEKRSDAIRTAADDKERALLDELIMSPDGKAALEKITATFA